MRLSLIVGLFCLFSALTAAELRLAKDGKTDYSIVYTAKEKLAAEELKLHLDQMTGADFKMVEESAWKDEGSKPAFYLGSTNFAKKQNLPTKELKTEEFNMKTVGKNIVITGGITRGTLYGVYDLLEQFGCRWYAYDTTVIPKKKELTLGEVQRRHNPSFEIRQFSDDFYRSKSRGKEIHQKTTEQKRRIRATVNLWSPISTRYGTSHTFYQFVNPNVHFEKHPEYFSMDANGKRFRGTALGGWEGGGICMTNPDVIEMTWNKLVEYIELDRKELPEDKWPLIYDISMQDAIPYLCYCPECKKISKREESESGLLVHFLNQIGSRLKEKYPELKIKTLAYVDCSKAPKHIRPLDNLIFQWCNLYTVNDCFRPITHEFNKAQKAEYDGWRKIGATTALWEYWNMGGRYFSPLRVETCFDGIAENIRYYHKNGSTLYYCEFTPDYDRQHSQNFAFLNLYVAYKLLYDVSLDENELVKDFMQGYYGPAAKPMTEFMNLVRAELKKVDMPLPTFETRRPYYSEEFMKKVWGYIEESLRLTEPGSLYRSHIEMEMLAPMSVILRNGYNVGDRDFMMKEFRRIRTERIESTKVNPTVKQSYRDQLEAEMVNFIQLKLEVPAQFKGKNIIHIGWPKIGWSGGNKPGTYVNDPEAAGGKTVAVMKRKNYPHDMNQKVHNGFTPLDFGFYDKDSEKQLHKHYDKDSIPQDEKYHWYRVGQFVLGQGTFLWGFYWTLQSNLSEYYRIADGIKNANFVTAWVHVKITGPAYVKGSTKENGIFVDQIILVRPKGK